jgi:hypothetical protein
VTPREGSEWIVKRRQLAVASRFLGGLLVVKGHDDDHASTLLESLDTPGQLIAIETRHRRLIRHEGPSKLFQQLFRSARTATQIEHGHPACALHKRRELVRVA